MLMLCERAWSATASFHCSSETPRSRRCRLASSNTFFSKLRSGSSRRELAGARVDGAGVMEGEGPHPERTSSRAITINTRTSRTGPRSNCRLRLTGTMRRESNFEIHCSYFLSKPHYQLLGAASWRLRRWRGGGDNIEHSVPGRED